MTEVKSPSYRQVIVSGARPSGKTIVASKSMDSIFTSGSPSKSRSVRGLRGIDFRGRSRKTPGWGRGLVIEKDSSSCEESGRVAVSAANSPVTEPSPPHDEVDIQHQGPTLLDAERAVRDSKNSDEDRYVRDVSLMKDTIKWRREDEKSVRTSKPSRHDSGINLSSTSMESLPTCDPHLRLSQLLSWILRHGAQRCGMQLRKGGYLFLDEILSLPRFQDFTEADVEDVVARDDKNRFTLDRDRGRRRVKANHGHSVQASSSGRSDGSSKSSGQFGRRKRQNMDRSERLSRTLASILRHSAEEHGLQLMRGGYVYLDDVLELSPLKSRGYRFEDVKAVVDGDEKGRFHMTPDITDLSWKIRATGKHSLQFLPENRDAVFLPSRKTLTAQTDPDKVTRHSRDSGGARSRLSPKRQDKEPDNEGSDWSTELIATSPRREGSARVPAKCEGNPREAEIVQKHKSKDSEQEKDTPKVVKKMKMVPKWPAQQKKGNTAGKTARKSSKTKSSTKLANPSTEKRPKIENAV